MPQNETFENNNANEEYANDQDINNIPDVESNNDLNKENTSNEATAPSISDEERRKLLIKSMPTPKIPPFVKSDPPCEFHDDPSTWIEWLEAEVLKYRREQELKKKQEELEKLRQESPEPEIVPEAEPEKEPEKPEEPEINENVKVTEPPDDYDYWEESEESKEPEISENIKVTEPSDGYDYWEECEETKEPEGLEKPDINECTDEDFEDCEHSEYPEKSENHEDRNVPEEDKDPDLPEFDENVDPQKLVELLFGYKAKETKKFAKENECVDQDDIIANNIEEEENAENEDDWEWDEQEEELEPTTKENTSFEYETSKNESVNQEKVDLDLEEVHPEAISIKSELEQKDDGDLQDNADMHLEQHSIDEAQNINNNDKKKDCFTTADASVSVIYKTT